ncbi:E3 ubiquitin-protein ligase bre-1-like isoform X1 [Zingiber officinale]|uniref:E3 ubiquitin-protein ligase bre-1-like isoform X1 n=1 Tax=Zingiber officinale TaxID=94328 RepID=UPI001C4C7BB5|nr:E3 ubiquitin-protein ligase bre-1-like isoform X1 [Zingiber officinale]XP_042416868.1 E3 ubiquitin-protein ligase bre-1-like isoform X1 [Zingiber officinale]XP_042416869.1 E3 ubiquitin-protein ligase bre-1-like isoform X1 [Zingiber officinale]
MTTLGPPRRVAKRRSQVKSRAKIDVVDLNSPSIVSHELEMSSGSAFLQVSQGTSVSMNSHRIHPTGQHRSSAAPSNDAPNSFIIDVEEIEDEVQLLPLLASGRFREARNLSRRNQPSTVFLDEELDTDPRSVATARSSGNKIVINCDLYPDLQDENSKGKKVVESIQDPPKQPTFSCPICMNTMTEATSTICGHIFCKSCIVASIQAQKKCPTCRRKLNMNNFHRVYLPNSDWLTD